MRKNAIFERARFNKRNQLEGESAESYITTLYELAENCDYGALKSEMIRDRLVVGIRDNALSDHERLQTKEGLTLEKAKTMIRQREAVREQQSTLKEAAVEEPSSYSLKEIMHVCDVVESPTQGINAQLKMPI